MPNSGPVYQPTTMTYDQQTPDSDISSWTRPISHLSQSMSDQTVKARLIQWLILLLGLFLVVTGLVMMVDSIIDYTNSQRESNEGQPGIEGPGSVADLVLAVLGGVFLVVGIMLLGFYIRMCRHYKYCTTLCGKEFGVSSSRDNGVAACGALNPSTDLLVNAQYVPVSEVAYQPPAALAAEERRQLMVDGKESITAEEPDMMLESDPRIVLKPQSKIEEVA